MKIRINLLSVSLTVFLATTVAHTASDVTSDLQKSVNDYYQTYNKKEKFTAIAASVLIPQNSLNNKKEVKTVVAGTVGYSPFSTQITANNLFDIGSITKSFTALLLLQLHAEGKLTLDDPLGKWLPQYPQWKEVHLRQLLNMTSGIPNYSEDAEFTKKVDANLGRTWTNEELLTYAHPDKPLPKKRTNLYEYCNSNYILAALVIEKVTKDTFANQLKLRIVNAQNGLNSMYYPAGPDGNAVQKAIQHRKVHGYFYDEHTKRLIDTFDNNLSWAGAAGALVATTEDVVHWVQLLYHGSLIKLADRVRVLAELESIVSLKTGLPISNVSEDEMAGFGLGVVAYYDKELKERFWVYKGSTLSFRIMYFWQPCNNVTTVVALNGKGGEGNPDSKLGDEIVRANLNLYHLIMKHYPDLRCEM